MADYEPESPQVLYLIAATYKVKLSLCLTN
jgi:hypothetical protein